jgi:hypothetical protein
LLLAEQRHHFFGVFGLSAPFCGSLNGGHEDEAMNLTGNCSFRDQRVLDRCGYGQAKKCSAFDKIGNARDYQGREAGGVFWRCCFRLRGQTQAGAKSACN